MNIATQNTVAARAIQPANSGSLIIGAPLSA